MRRQRKETETILDHCHARRTKKSRRSANTWWQMFCAVTELPVVLDLNFVRENQRHHDEERGCGHHETPQRYCAPVLSDHDELEIDLRRYVRNPG